MISRSFSIHVITGLENRRVCLHVCCCINLILYLLSTLVLHPPPSPPLAQLLPLLCLPLILLLLSFSASPCLISLLHSSLLLSLFCRPSHPLTPLSLPLFSLPSLPLYPVSPDSSDPRARRLGRLLAANVLQLVEEKIPQLYIPPSSTYDQYLRGLRALPASYRQTGAGSCNEVSDCSRRSSFVFDRCMATCQFIASHHSTSH